MSTNLFERVLKTIRNYGMLKAGDTVLVAVSGGPDSSRDPYSNWTARMIEIRDASRAG